MDNKYMIEMAENRGLFGDTSNTSGRTKSRSSKKKQERKVASKPVKSKKRIKAIEVIKLTFNESIKF